MSMESSVPQLSVHALISLIIMYTPMWLGDLLLVVLRCADIPIFYIYLSHSDIQASRPKGEAPTTNENVLRKA